MQSLDQQQQQQQHKEEEDEEFTVFTLVMDFLQFVEASLNRENLEKLLRQMQCNKRNNNTSNLKLIGTGQVIPYEEAKKLLQHHLSDAEMRSLEQQSLDLEDKFYKDNRRRAESLWTVPITKSMKRILVRWWLDKYRDNNSNNQALLSSKDAGSLWSGLLKELDNNNTSTGNTRGIDAVLSKIDYWSNALYEARYSFDNLTCHCIWKSLSRWSMPTTVRIAPLPPLPPLPTPPPHHVWDKFNTRVCNRSFPTLFKLLDEENRRLFYEWLRQGCPNGDPKKLYPQRFRNGRSPPVSESDEEEEQEEDEDEQQQEEEEELLQLRRQSREYRRRLVAVLDDNLELLSRAEALHPERKAEYATARLEVLERLAEVYKAQGNTEFISLL